MEKIGTQKIWSYFNDDPPVTVAATIQKTGQGEPSQIVVPLDAVSVIDGKPVVSGIFQAAHPA